MNHDSALGASMIVVCCYDLADVRGVCANVVKCMCVERSDKVDQLSSDLLHCMTTLVRVRSRPGTLPRPTSCSNDHVLHKAAEHEDLSISDS